MNEMFLQFGKAFRAKIINIGETGEIAPGM